MQPSPPFESEQLITAFYLLSVEESETYREVAKAILHRYMIERGYTARWTGRYVQGGRFIGNSDHFQPLQHEPSPVRRGAPPHPGSQPRLLRRERAEEGERVPRVPLQVQAERGEGERYVPEKRLKRRSVEDERSLVKDAGNEEEDWEDYRLPGGRTGSHKV